MAYRALRIIDFYRPGDIIEDDVYSADEINGMLKNEQVERLEKDAPPIPNLAKLPVAKLREMAKGAGIEGYTKLKKRELVDVLGGG
jgi:hypothetical protein